MSPSQFCPNSEVTNEICSGVASVAIRSLHHAAEVLTKRTEQEEVMQIFEKINKETGWRIGFVYKDLKEKWGWNEDATPQQFAQTHTAARQAREQQEQLQEQALAAQQRMQSQQGYDFNRQSMNQPMPQHPPPPAQQTMQPSPAPTSNSSSTPAGGGSAAGGGGAPRKMPQGIPNPMYAKADFNLPQHPYQNFYVAPNNVSAQWNPAYGQLYYNL